MKEPLNAELVGLVYDTALDEAFWPDILQALAKELMHSLDNMPDLQSTQENRSELGDDAAQIKALRPFLHSALKLNKIHSAKHNNIQILKSLLDTYPVSVMIVDGNLQILTANQTASTVLEQSQSIEVKNNYLHFTNLQHLALVQNFIKHTDWQNIDINSNILKFNLDKPDKTKQTVLIAPHIFPDSPQPGDYFAVFLSTPHQSINLSSKAMMSEFALSKSEAYFVMALAQGKSLKDYAEETKLSVNTLKSHLRSIFKKTNVNRTSQLIHKILTSASFYIQPQKAASKSPSKRIDSSNYLLANQEHDITLADGRHLVCAEFGDPKGFPVFFFHGKYGGRFMRNPNDKMTYDLGVRLIVADRPGYGLSTPNPKGTFTSWTDDFKQLLTHLSITQCSVMALEVGAPYALACAGKLPEIKKLIVCNSYAPDFKISDFRDMIPMERLFLALAKYIPGFFRQFSQYQLKKLTQNLDWYYERLLNYLPEADRKILSDPTIVEFFKQASIIGLKEPMGFSHDCILNCKNWHIDFDAVQCETEIWHGKENRHIPFKMANQLAQRLPKAKLHIIENQGHFMALSLWREFLLSAKSPVSSLPA